MIRAIILAAALTVTAGCATTQVTDDDGNVVYKTDKRGEPILDDDGNQIPLTKQEVDWVKVAQIGGAASTALPPGFNAISGGVFSLLPLLFGGRSR